MPVDLVRGGGGPALQGHDLVEMLPHGGIFTVDPHFVSGGGPILPLAGCAYIAPGDVIGSSQVLLIGIRLSDVSFWDEGEDWFVKNVGGAPMTDSTPCMDGTGDPKAPPSALLSGLDPGQRTASLALWQRIRNHLRDINFDLQSLG